MLQSCIEIGTFEVLQLIKHSNTKIKQTHNIEEYIVSNLLIKSQKKENEKDHHIYKRARSYNVR